MIAANTMKRMLVITTLLGLLISSLIAQEKTYPELIRLAGEAYSNKEYAASGRYYDEAFQMKKGTADDYYNAACSWALAGDKEKALAYLREAIDVGWIHLDHTKKDTDLAALHDTKEWARLIDQLRKKAEEYESHLDRPLTKELQAIQESDQGGRLMMDSVRKAYGWDSPQMKELWTRQSHTDSVNITNIKEIIREHGYPGKSLVGDMSGVAWLVIQHANLATQEEYLPVLREAADKGELEMSSFALLVDRVKMGKGEKQIYGSQLQMKDGKYVLYPIEDEPNVDKRRAEMGLGPLEQYLKYFGIEYKPEQNR